MNWDAHLRLRHIRTFLEIARAESVSIAADRLNITQPAVSRSLKELEAILGATLFDRVGRGLRLNKAGRVFQAHASASMVELLRGRERVAKDGGFSAHLSVGVLPTAATDLLPRAALAFHAEMPHVRLHMLTGPNWLLFNQLRDGALDLVVGRMPENDALMGVTFQQLFVEDVVLVCAPDHALVGEPEPEHHIADYTLILPPKGAMIHQTVTRYLTSIGLPELRGAFETVSLPIGRKIVSGSDAIWFISRGVVADDLARGELVALASSSPLLSGPVGISVASAAPINVARSMLGDCLRVALLEND